MGRLAKDVPCQEVCTESSRLGKEQESFRVVPDSHSLSLVFSTAVHSYSLYLSDLILFFLNVIDR